VFLKITTVRFLNGNDEAAGLQSSGSLCFYGRIFANHGRITHFKYLYIKLDHMKKYLLVALLVTALSSPVLEGQEKYIQSAVTHVTVFRQGAQLSGDALINLQPGTWDFVAGGLSPYIDPNSIQVRGEGDFMIMGVAHRNNYLENPAESDAISTLRSKIKALDLKLEDEGTALEVLLERERFLKANYDIVANKSTITPEQFRALMDLYGTNMETVKSAILKKNRVMRDLKEEKEKLEQQLSGTLDRSKMPTGEIVVTVSGSKAANGRLKLSYVVMNAGWRPSYDIRVDDVSDPAVIIYKADIWQNSGIEWKDVKVSLSNAAPMTAGYLPDLNPWFVDFYQEYSLNEVVVMGYGTKARPARQAKAEEAAMMDLEASAPMPVTVTESNISFSFDINVPRTISSGDKPETVELQRLTVPATYSYAVTPKLASTAYLMGYITDWDKYNLLPGESNIYFSNTFTGKGYINTAELTDTLPVSLGADNSITVKRDRRTDFTSQKLIGANRVETLSFLISVRNNKSKAVTVRLRDQIPLSQNSDITVEAAELSGGRHNSTTGEVTWELTVAPGQTKEVIFTYSVKYPKNRKVILE
jgi:uncharacterized protein (TIGR02231 family)